MAEGCRRGETSRLIVTLPNSHVIFSERQGCRGWCVLVLRDHVEHLSTLDVPRQMALFGEVAAVAQAIREVFPTTGAGGGPPRINYESLGNQVPHVHWHVIPRHADDPDPHNAVWLWPPKALKGAMADGDRDRIMDQLYARLKHLRDPAAVDPRAPQTRYGSRS